MNTRINTDSQKHGLTLIFISVFIGVSISVFISAPTARASILLKSPPNNMGIVGFWNFNAGTGTSVADSSGSGNTGTWAGTGSHWTGGKFSNGGSFNGTDDYVSRPSAAGSVLDLTSRLSVSAWVKPSAWTSNNRIVEKYWANSYYLGINNSGGGFDFIVNAVTAREDTGLTAGQWYHVVGTYDGLNINLYRNGVLAGTATSTPPAGNANDFTIGATPGGGVYWTGSIDEVRIYNRALSAVEVRTLYNSTGVGKVSGITANGLVGYWPFSEGGGTTTADKSGNGNTGTLTNFALATTTSNWATGKFGTGLNFDGVDDLVSNSNFSWPTGGPVTVSLWVNTPGGQPNSAFSVGNMSEPNRFQAHLPWADNVLYWDYGDIDAAGRISTPFASYLNQWTHVVLVSQGNGGSFKAIYINGALITSSTASSDGPNQALTGITIGKYTNGSANYYFTGSIDDVRVYNRALSANEVKAIYNQTRDMPVYAKVNVTRNNPASNLQNGLVGWWPFDGKYMTTTTATDISGSNNTGTLTGANGLPVPTIGKLGSALRFDGVDDYVTTPSQNSTLSNSPFSVSVWFKNTGTSAFGGGSNYGSLVTNNHSPGSGNYGVTGFSVGLTSNLGQFVFNAGDGTTGSNWGVDNAYTRGAWTHWVVVYPNNGTIKLYVNGVLFDTNNSFSITGDIVSSDPLLIGSDNQHPLPFNGSIDDVRVYNKALSADEVGQLYRMGK